MPQLTQANYTFLEQLKKNNNRQWFEKHKDEYDTYHQEVITFADAVLAEVTKFDVIETVNGKKSLHRIYRDIRFSKDKTPYKTHWGGAFKRAGQERRGGYYFHLEKGNFFVGGGFWAPDNKDLLHIRKQLDLDAKPLRKVLNSKAFKDYFKELEGEKLKSSPKGFESNNENIDLINYKQFIVWHKFTDKEAFDKNFYKEVARGFKNMLPFFNVMTNYLTTNLNGESLLK